MLGKGLLLKTTALLLFFLCTAKSYHPVILLSVINKVFEKLVNNRIVDHLEKRGFFLISSLMLGFLTLVLLIWKRMDVLLRKSHLLRCWGWLTVLNWIVTLRLSIVKTAFKKVGTFVLYMKSLSPEVALYLKKIYHWALHGRLLSCLGWCS